MTTLTGVLRQNIEKVVINTERADRVMSDMLARHRGAKGEFVPVDINQPVRQQTMVAYRTAQSQIDGHVVDMQMNPDPEVSLVRVVPDDRGRVIVDLVVDSCQAAVKKMRNAGGH